MKILDKFASIIIDPSNSKRSSSAQALSWAVTIIMGVGSLGLVQGLCILWRRVHPVEKNDTHEKIEQIFRKFFPKSETTKQEEAESQASQKVADQPSAEIPNTAEESTTRAEKSSSQEKTAPTEKLSPKDLPSVQKDSQQTMVTAPTPTPAIELPLPPVMPTLDVYVEVDSDGCEPFVDYLKTKFPPECRFHLVKRQYNRDTMQIERSDDIQNRKELIYIYLTLIYGRADSARCDLARVVTERGLLNIIPIFLCSEGHNYKPRSVEDYQKSVPNDATQSMQLDGRIIGQLQGQEPRVYGIHWKPTRYGGENRIFPNVVDDKYWNEQEPVATPISEIGPAIAKYQKALFKEQEREKKEQNKPNTQT